MIDQSVLVSAGFGFAGVLVGAVIGLFSKRVEKAPDMQATLNAAVDKVVQHYQEALTRSDAELETARAEALSLREEISEVRRLQEEQTAKIDEQSAEIRRLVEHIARLEAEIVALGGQPPVMVSTERKPRRRVKPQGDE